MSINTGLDLKTSFLRVKVVYNKSEVSSILVIKIQVYSKRESSTFLLFGLWSFW